MPSFKNAAHEAAYVIQTAWNFFKKFDAAVIKVAAPAAAGTVEALTEVTLGDKAVAVEKAVFAVAGEVDSFISKADAAALAQFKNLGFDMLVIDSLKAIKADLPKL